MKTCVVSPFVSATRSEILAFLETMTARLVMLPGVARNTPTPEAVQAVIGRDVSVFVEFGGRKAKATPYLVTRRTVSPMPRQIFGEHPSAAQMDKLAENLPARTFTVGDRQVTFLICGENIAFSPDGSTKHKRRLAIPDILANPAHSLMSRWQHLGRKFAELSRRSAFLHAANNNRESPDVTTDVRIYRRGRLMPGRQVEGRIAWCECDV
jgi:hypothetical protein